jgi:hypothetical protein
MGSSCGSIGFALTGRTVVRAAMPGEQRGWLGSSLTSTIW